MDTSFRVVGKALIQLVVTVAVIWVLLFGSAGTLDWPRAWWFMAAFVVAILIAVAVLYRLNPEIFAARARVQPGTKLWDYIFIALVIGGMVAILPVAGFDRRLGGAGAPELSDVLPVISCPTVLAPVPDSVCTAALESGRRSGTAPSSKRPARSAAPNSSPRISGTARTTTA